MHIQVHAASGDALIGTPPWLSKWPVMEVHSFATAAYFDCCNCSYGPWYGPLKLMPSSNINLEGFISLFVSYWLPPKTMDAVSATIVADG
jgi:hypothetical protein